MDGFRLIYIAMFGVSFIVWTGLTWAARFRRRILDSYARRVDLAVPVDLECRLERRVTILQRAEALGGLAGTIVAAVVVAALIPPLDFSRDVPPVDPAVVVLLISVAAGLMLSRCLAAMFLTLRPRAGRRMARSTTPHLTDYVSRVEQAAAWVASGLALIVVTSVWFAHRHGIVRNIVIEREGVFDNIGALFAYLAAASLVAGSVLGRAVLHSPQAAGSTQELAWDDALRAVTLRWLVGMPIQWGAQSIILSFSSVLVGSSWHPGWMAVVVGLMFAGTWAGWFAMLYIARNSVMDRHFRRRLWTEAVLVTR